MCTPKSALLNHTGKKIVPVGSDAKWLFGVPPLRDCSPAQQLVQVN